jgi:predicted chitinase
MAYANFTSFVSNDPVNTEENKVEPIKCEYCGNKNIIDSVVLNFVGSKEKKKQKRKDEIISGILPYLRDESTTYMAKAEVNTCVRWAHFIAQCSIESSGFSSLVEGTYHTDYSRILDLFPSKFNGILKSDSEKVQNLQEVEKKLTDKKTELEKKKKEEAEKAKKTNVDAVKDEDVIKLVKSDIKLQKKYNDASTILSKNKTSVTNATTEINNKTIELIKKIKSKMEETKDHVDDLVSDVGDVIKCLGEYATLNDAKTKIEGSNLDFKIETLQVLTVEIDQARNTDTFKWILSDFKSNLETASKEYQKSLDNLKKTETVFSKPDFDAAFTALNTARENEAKAYLKKSVFIANRTYSDDEENGEGWKYRGRGIIQLTLKGNYSKFNTSTFNDSGKNIEENPDLVAEYRYAVASSAEYWKRNNINDKADVGISDLDVSNVTVKINTKREGLAQRQSNFHILVKYLHCNFHLGTVEYNNGKYAKAKTYFSTEKTNLTALKTENEKTKTKLVAKEKQLDEENTKLTEQEKKVQSNKAALDKISKRKEAIKTEKERIKNQKKDIDDGISKINENIKKTEDSLTKVDNALKSNAK